MRNIVLLSGGLDSSALLCRVAVRDPKNTLGLFFDYGQKSVARERTAANSIAYSCGVTMETVDLCSVFRFSKSTLLAHVADSVTQVVKNGNKMVYRSEGTEVEFRNGVFLAVAISFAMQKYPEDEVTVYYGAILTREPFPDCSVEFVEQFDALARLCSQGRIRVAAPFAEKGKDAVFKEALRLGVPIEKTWSCYEGGEKPCGVCPACIDRKIVEGRLC